MNKGLAIAFKEARAYSAHPGWKSRDRTWFKISWHDRAYGASKEDREQDRIFSCESCIREKDLIIFTALGLRPQTPVKRRRRRSLTFYHRAVLVSVGLKCNDLLVITWDREEEEHIGNNKVVYLPLWKWLLKYTDAEL
ncbi:MAG: hypothetical protein Q7J35_08720 [Candidatus Methanoperedens sp.]|nr:hypothetical protein [Candidatus Methanoperedens sp.]